MVTLGYLSEKNKLIADPKMANNRERVHMRGVLRFRGIVNEVESLSVSRLGSSSSMSKWMLSRSPSSEGRWVMMYSDPRRVSP
jgi:hypothetical protein